MLAKGMRKHSIIFIFSLLLILIVTDVEAQRRRNRGYRSYRPGGSGFNVSTMLHSLNFNVGYYRPRMDYWNNDSYLAELGKNYNGAIMFQGGIDLDIYDGFMVGLYGGTYSDKVEVYNQIGGIERTEKHRYRITPISIVGKYQFNFGNPRLRYRQRGLAKIHPYGGVAGNFNLITNTLVREFTDPERETQRSTNNGTTLTISGIVGVRYDLTHYVGIGAEVNYFVGGFNQTVNTGNGQTEDATISITGPFISGTLSVNLQPPKGRRRARYR